MCVPTVFQQFCTQCSWKSRVIAKPDCIYPGAFDDLPKICPKCGGKLESRGVLLDLSLASKKPWWQFW